MGVEITKTFTMSVKYSRDDGEDLAVSSIQYQQMLTEMTKRITEQAEASMGIVSSHIVGSVSVV